MRERPIRLAVLGSRGIPAKHGAFEVFAERLSLALIKQGWDVTVFCPHYQSHHEDLYQGVRLRYIWHPRGGAGSLIYDGLSVLSATLSRFDAILMLGYGSSPFLLLPRLRAIPTVVNTDGLEWKRSKWPWYARAYFRMAERLVTRLATVLVSDAQGIQRYYERRYGVTSQYIPYGTELPDDPVYKTLHALQEGLQAGMYYLVVMRLEPENSILEIVRGFLASHSTRKLVIVGPSTPFFESQVQPLLRTGDRVRYLGPMYQREQVFALRRGAFAYIHGHTVGGTNPTLLEAMASENVIIARDVEFNREVVGNLGFYFDSAEDLARTLERVERLPPEILQEKGKACRRVVESRYVWPLVTEAYADLITRVVRRRAEPLRTG